MIDLISAYWVLLAIVAAIGAATGFWILSSRRHVDLPRIEIGQPTSQTLARRIDPAPGMSGAEVPAASLPPLPFAVFTDHNVEPDDLMRIKGIGPRLAKTLIDMGIVYYRQIKAWSPDDIAAVDARLGVFAGRIERDNWVDQARLLDANDIAAYEEKFGALIGGV